MKTRKIQSKSDATRVAARHVARFLGRKSLLRIGALLITVGLVASGFYSASSASSSTSRVNGFGAVSSGVRVPNGLGSSLLNPFKYGSMFAGPLVPPPAPMITTYESTCTTPKASFDLGETVCAIITGANQPVDGVARSRTGWVSPYGSLTQGGEIDSDPKTASYTIPATQTQTFTDSGGGTVTVDNRGTWKLGVYSASDGSLQGEVEFVVHDPATPYVDLYAIQTATAGESEVAAGSSSAFHIFVGNDGPDAGQNVVLTDNVPANTTLVAIVQTSGPTFSCSGVAAGGTGTITCTIASLARGASASFDLAYNVNGTTPPGTIISNTATISSDTAELRPGDNSWTQTAKVVAASTGGGTNTCTVACPDDIITEANTTQSGQDGAIVHFSPPSGNEECGVIVVDHCNDCFFPVGVTTVTATSATLDTCSFTVTVTAPGSSTTISCPANQTGTANSSCEASINVGTASATGTNVTVIGTRSDGKPMYTCDAFGNCTRNSSDAPFSAGVTTITWIAYSHDVPGPYTGPVDGNGDPVNPADTEEGHRTGSASCTQTVTVNDVTPPVIAATDSSASADASCQAPVPDYSNTVSDNCACSNSDTSEDCQGHPHFTVTQSPAAGTMVGPGPTTVTITANDNSSNNNGAGNTSTKNVTFTVNDTTAPTITNCPSNQTVNTAPGTCEAAVNPGTATATDNCDSSPTITGTRSDSQPLNAPYPKGTTTITWRATDDAGNFSECQQTVTVEDHENPTIVCPAPTSASADASCQAPIPDRRAEATTADNCGNVTVTQSPAPGTMVGLGTHTITLTATDSSGNTASCTTTFTVNDTTAPTITITSQTFTMWPPNHQYQTFLVSQFVTGVSDNCTGGLNSGNVVIASAYSDETENGGGDGNTNNDIIISADCKSIQLRRERQESGNGRVYTINVVVKDAAGNVGTASVKVKVPKSEPNGTAVDDGPNYTVNGTCPP